MGDQKGNCCRIEKAWSGWEGEVIRREQQEGCIQWEEAWRDEGSREGREEKNKTLPDCDAALLLHLLDAFKRGLEESSFIRNSIKWNSRY